MSFARDAPVSAIYSATYGYCKKKSIPKQEDGAEGSLNVKAISVAHASAGIVISTLSTLINTVKSRLQAANSKPRASRMVKSIYSGEE